MSERLLRARDVADLLGVSPSTVLDWWEDGRLPGFRLSSRAVRFRESEVLAWLEAKHEGKTQESFVALDRSES
jgi:excisionase family DNA binding protein